MTQTPSRPKRRARKPRHWVRALVGTLLVAAVFLLGVALGQATESTPEPGPPATQTRTIVPVPATEVTVTVTTTVPSQP